MKTIQILIAYFFCFQYSLAQGFISTRGSSFFDENGKEIQMKGVCLANWLVPEGYMLQLEKADSPRKINNLLNELVGPEETQQFWQEYLSNYIAREDIQLIKSLGFDHVRLYIHYQMLTEDDYMGQNQHGFALIDRVIDWCREEGLYVLLDMHCAPCGQSGENYDDSFGYPWLYKSASCRSQMIQIWETIAQRYKDDSTVMGYDLLNAPLAPLFDEDMAVLNDSLRSLYQQAINAIRAIDQQHLIFVQFPEYHQNLEALTGLHDEKIVYSLQRYFTKTDQSAVQPYLDFARARQAPIYVCEFGENTLQWMSEMRRLFDKNNISWCLHPYKELQGSIFFVETDDPSSVVGFSRPAHWDTIQNFVNVDRSSFAELRKHRPPISQSRQALGELLENCKLENCTINLQLIEALDLNNQ